MKLYRGLKSAEYKEFSQEVMNKLHSEWREILKKREQGDLRYPEEYNKTIANLFKLEPITRQYFTDNKKIAENYAKKEKGLVLVIDVPIEDVLKNFIIEFQNYPKRRTSFEIVYMVKGKDLFAHTKKWNLEIIKL